MNAPTPHSLTPELVSNGLKQLASIRAAAMAAVVNEMQATLPAWIAAEASGEIPSGVPEWMLSCFASADLPGGGVCWKTIQEAFAVQTVKRIENTQLSEQVTGASLSRFLCIDLEAFSREGWDGIETYAATQSAKESQ